MAGNTRLPRKLRSFLRIFPTAVRSLPIANRKIRDQRGKDYDAPGHLNLSSLQQLHVPQTADFYLCGPPAFLTELTAALTSWGVPYARIHSETFGTESAVTPGIAARPPKRRTHRPEPRGRARTFPLPEVVSRSHGIPAFQPSSNSRKPAMFLSGGRAG